MPTIMPVWDRLDPFEIYRWVLAILGSSYSVVVTAYSLTQYASSLAQIGPHGSLLRRYLIVHALRLRVRRFGWDLLHIGILVMVLLYLVGLHRSWRIFEL